MLTFAAIQAILRQHGVDAWFLYDFRKSNNIAHATLGLPEDGHFTRRWAVMIPAEGAPVKIVNAIERHSLAAVDCEELTYASREQWEAAVSKVLAGKRRIALEYSPLGNLPIVAKVDAGTVEWLRTLGVEPVSSADIVQQCTAVWTQEQFEDNKITSHALKQAMSHSFHFMRDNLQAGIAFTEFEAQQQILHFFAANGLATYSPPIVAVNANAANPHYEPSAEHSALVQRGDVILVDMWARLADKPKSTYADITWMAFAGDVVPERPQALFRVIADGRDAVVAHLHAHLGKHLGNDNDNTSTQPVRGCDLDDICRAVVVKAGYGEYFIHRTGHSILTDTTHGPGANLDNYETQDTRLILPMTSFSVEPGIYIPGDIGLRTEIDVVVAPDYTPLIWSAPIQHHITPLLADDVSID
jgi:Xaa-Pro dipeptidase